MKNKYGVFKLLYITVLLYAFSTITQSLYSISLNRIWTVGIIACIFYIILSPAYKKTVFYLGGILIVGVWTTISSRNLGQNINDFIYFATTSLWLIFLAKYENRSLFYKAAINNKTITKLILLISYAAVLIPLLTKTGFAYQWGSTPYFVGFAGTQHAMASSMCLLTAIYLLISLESKFSWWNLAVIMFGAYVVFETGARTFIIPIAILLFYYIHHNIKDMNLKTIVYAVGVIAVLYLIQNSSMLDKFSFVSSGGNMAANALDGFTSGRSLFWTVDLNAFSEGNIIQIFLGRGFDYVYDLNASTVNQRIWAHNDFIHLLLGGGLFAFGLYINIIYRFFKKMFKDQGRLNKLMLVIYLLFPAFINGFFMYQHLLLSMMVFCLCCTRMYEKEF